MQLRAFVRLRLVERMGALHAKSPELKIRQR